MVVNPWTSVKTIVISWRMPPSSVEIELSTTRLTISLGTKRANDEIAALMAATEDLEVTVDALIELARSRGAHDNVSIVVADVIA